MMNAEKKTKARSELDWLELSALISGLIGIAGLVALISQNVWAEAPRKGFQPGARTFTNPFANGPQGEEAFFDDDEDEDIDFTPGTSQGGFGSPSPPAGGFGTPGADTRRGAPKAGAVSAGGGNPSGVIQGANPPAPLHIDDETGEGSKEIVTDFNFPDADILDIAKTLGKLTGKNFILDKDVKGRITIISNSPISVGDAWRAFLTALDINGFALIPSGKYIRIARQRDARDKQLRTYVGDHSPDTDSLITRVFQLKYINAEEVARTFRSFMPANSRIIPYEQTNTVIVTDTGANIAKLNKMLEILDVEGYDAGIEVIPVKYASAAELSKLIDTLLPGTGGTAGAPGAPRFGGPSTRFSARRTKEGGIINTIIADDRTNTLIVHANSKGADQVRELVAKLDQKIPSPSGGGKVHVIYLQYADAEQISTTLNNLSQASGPARPSIPSLTGGTGINPVQASLFEGAIKVAPDKATNSLVVTASPGDFLTVQRVVNQLDIRRDEVYVEVVIMEISLNREFQYSTNVANPTSGIAFTPNTDLYDFIVNPLSQKGAIIGFKSGAETPYTIGTNTVKVSSIQGLIKAIQSNTNANVLATPQIIALDNSEATFESAEKIPVPTTTAVQGAGVSTSITKESVSLSIKIKPQINKVSNFVKLDVTTKLADISGRQPPAQVAGLAFSTLERNAQTTVVVGDSDTVVIGGLMRDKLNDSVSKIPILGDIPLLGWLFRAQSTTTEKTNLLIFLTPHIVRQYETVRTILDKKLKERDDFIENNAGGNDPLRNQRDEMIRNLPDIQELKNRKSQTAVTIDDDKPAAVPVEPTDPFSGSKGNTAPAPRDDTHGSETHSQKSPDALGGTPPVPPPPPLTAPESHPTAAPAPAPETAPPPPPAPNAGGQ